MKKILIVNNNMKIGGVQKSLYNLLWSIDTEKEYDVTLLLFSKSGFYINCLPKNVKIKECKGLFRLLGKSQGEYKSNLKDFLFRGFLSTLAHIFGRYFVLKLMLLFEPELDENFDCAISFMHNGPNNAFFGGTQDYVLKRVKAKKKIAFIHGDYINCGACHNTNNQLLGKFDLIAACSDGCRNVLVQALPELASRCITVRNFNRFDEIKNFSAVDATDYDSSFINVIMVARLSQTKGIDRAIKAVAFCVRKGLKVKLYVVGGGPLHEMLKAVAEDEGIREYIKFFGEQSNPYRYMKNADMFLLTSYHEAAPMVIDEARCLCLPVLTTQTTSSKEMVTEEGCGWVCENTQEALNEALFEVLSDKNKLLLVKNSMLEKAVDNSKALSQFDELIKN